MNFVKSGVYLQEYTDKGIKEKEIDVRDPHEKEREERLRKLPEFTNDPSFKSLAEQLAENDEEPLDTDGHIGGGDVYAYAPARITPEEAEFFDLLEKKSLQKEKETICEEERELENFRRSVAQAVVTITPTSDASTQNLEGINEPATSAPFQSPSSTETLLVPQEMRPKAAIVVKRKRPEVNGTVLTSPEKKIGKFDSISLKNTTEKHISTVTSTMLFNDYEDNSS